MRLLLTSIILFCSMSPLLLKAQADSTAVRVYTVSGLGFGLPGKSLKTVLKPKVSTRVGLDISVGNKDLFFSPALHLLAFQYDQQMVNSPYPYTVQNSRSAISTLMLPVGIRKRAGNFAFSGFTGPGGGLIKEPRIEIDAENQQAAMVIQNNWTLALTGGVGVEYYIGQFALFAEGSYSYHFKEIQNRSTQLFPLYVGVKSNISSVFK